MSDLAYDMTGRADALAELGEAIGRAGIPFEGGGVFAHGGCVTAYFLFRGGPSAKQVALSAGIRVVAMHRPLIRKLNQGSDVPTKRVREVELPRWKRIYNQFSTTGRRGRRVLSVDSRHYNKGG